MSTTARRVGKRWEIGLLWRQDDVRLPASYNYALNRLKSLERKMKKSPDFNIAYRKEIQYLLHENYACKIKKPRDDSLKLWYLVFTSFRRNKPE